MAISQPVGAEISGKRVWLGGALPDSHIFPLCFLFLLLMGWVSILFVMLDLHLLGVCMEAVICLSSQSLCRGRETDKYNDVIRLECNLNCSFAIRTSV